MKKYILLSILIILTSIVWVQISTDTREALASAKAKVKGDDQFVKFEKVIKEQNTKIESLVKLVSDIKLEMGTLKISKTENQDIVAGGDVVIGDPKMWYGAVGLLCSIIGLYIRKDFKQRKQLTSDRTEIIKLLAKKNDYKRSYYDKSKEVDKLSILVAKDK